MKSSSAAVVISAAILLASCAAAPLPRDVQPVAPTSVAAQMNKLYEDYFEDLLRLMPLAATFLGDERYNDRLQNTASPEFHRDMAELQRRYLERARRIPPAALNGSDRISYDVFTAERQQQLDGDRFPDWLLPIDQMDSMASTLAVLGSGASAQPFRNTGDYEKFLKRAAAFVTWSNSAIAAMREGMRRGVVQPRALMLKTVPQLRQHRRTGSRQERLLAAVDEFSRIGACGGSHPVAVCVRRVVRHGSVARLSAPGGFHRTGIPAGQSR